VNGGGAGRGERPWGGGRVGEVRRQVEKVGPTDRGGGEVPSIEGIERGF
jgi:hypothetical protein